MDWIQTVVLALVQGITEFLPVSSSAHLILFPEILGWPDQGLGFDIAVHLGSLIAVMLYFRVDIRILFIGLVKHITHKQSSPESIMAWAIIAATVPIVLMGLLLGDWVEQQLRSPVIIGVASIVFGLLLWVADQYFAQSRALSTLKIKDAWLIGIAQVLAMIPGTSRSGITMTAARGLGFDREAAARFSFLISIPTIALAFGWSLLKMSGGEIEVDFPKMLVGIILSAVVAWLSIHYFLAWIKRTSMTVFVIYRVLLGMVLIWVFA